MSRFVIDQTCLDRHPDLIALLINSPVKQSMMFIGA
jgi:hypothetical protein